MNQSQIYFNKYKQYKDLYCLQGGDDPKIYRKYKMYKHLHKKNAGARGIVRSSSFVKTDREIKDSVDHVQRKLDELTSSIQKFYSDHNTQMPSLADENISDDELDNIMEETSSRAIFFETKWLFKSRIDREHKLKESLRKQFPDVLIAKLTDKIDDYIKAKEEEAETLEPPMPISITHFKQKYLDFSPLTYLDASGHAITGPPIPEVRMDQIENPLHKSKKQKANDFFLASSIALTDRKSRRPSNFNCKTVTRKGNPQKDIWTDISIGISKRKGDFFPTIVGVDGSITGSPVFIDGFWDIPDRALTKPTVRHRVNLHLITAKPNPNDGEDWIEDKKILDIAFTDHDQKKKFLNKIIFNGSQPMYYSDLLGHYDHNKFRKILDVARADSTQHNIEANIQNIKKLLIDRELEKINQAKERLGSDFKEKSDTFTRETRQTLNDITEHIKQLKRTSQQHIEDTQSRADRAIELSGNEKDRLQQQLNESQNELEATQTKLDKEQTSLRQKIGQITSLEASNASLQSQLKESKAATREAERRLNKIRGERETSIERKVSVRVNAKTVAMTASWERERRKRASEILEANRKVTALEEQITLLKQEKDAIQVKLNECEHKLLRTDEEKIAAYREHAAANDWNCPITMKLMKDPVVAPDDKTYERVAIEQWFAQNPLPGTRSPMTNEVLHTQNLRENTKMKRAIQDWCRTTDPPFDECVEQGYIR